MRIYILSALCLGLCFAPLGAAGPKTKFGHRAYAEAPAAALAEAGPYRQSGRVVKLRREAAEAFLKMQAAARAQNIRLIPVSGFRTRAYQNTLFKRAIKKNGSPREAARWVAPPGYSEHHAGYSLDVGEDDAPAADVDPSFEDTPAYEWLSRRAAEHGFELSFPKNNPQGVSHEPWHWRFIGTPEARRLFYPDEK